MNLFFIILSTGGFFLNCVCDFRMSPIILLPVFFAAFTDISRIFLYFLLGLCLLEDIFFGKILGVTPFAITLFSMMYKHFFPRLFQLENPYLLWCSFGVFCIVFQGLMWAQYKVQHGFFSVNSASIFAWTLTMACFPFVLKRMVRTNGISPR